MPGLALAGLSHRSAEGVLVKMLAFAGCVLDSFRRVLGRGVERRCRRVVRGLELPQPFSVEGFCRLLEFRYGPRHPRRPVYLKPLPTPTDPETPSGMWLATPTSDFVFLDPQTSRHHWTRIFLHEAGHMVMGHDGLALEDNHYLYRKLASGDPEWIRHLPRIRYTDRTEREAETFADLLWQRIVRESARLPADGPLSGWETAMGFHRVQPHGRSEGP